jgi:dihydrofolate synthase/folylpolyglutamate synthase
VPPTSPIEAALERLGRLHPKKIDLSLGRLTRVLAALGHPERRLPPVVHVAGTNGKGSVVAYTSAIAEAAGLTVHRYTSPHLVRFNERITLVGREIGDETLADALDRTEAANGDAPITFFEVTTAAAFLAMAESPADLAVIEVGLGGRLDATNVIGAPLVAAITRIGHDHQEFLGPSLTGIAREKAGIIKPGAPVVIGPQADPQVVATLDGAAQAAGAPAALAGRDWRLVGGTVERGEAPSIDLPALPLPGRHQAENAAIAAMVALTMAERRPDWDIDGQTICAGLARARWPARLQRLTRGPLVEGLPADTGLWLDGGHNPDAAEAMAAWLAEEPERPTRLILGMMANKDHAGYLAPLADRVAHVHAVAIPKADCAAPDALCAVASTLGLSASSARTVAEAVSAARSGERVVIAGSLYLAGHILTENG